MGNDRGPHPPPPARPDVRSAVDAAGGGGLQRWDGFHGAAPPAGCRQRDPRTRTARAARASRPASRSGRLGRALRRPLRGLGRGVRDPAGRGPPRQRAGSGGRGTAGSASRIRRRTAHGRMSGPGPASRRSSRNLSAARVACVRARRPGGDAAVAAFRCRLDVAPAVGYAAERAARLRARARSRLDRRPQGSSIAISCAIGSCRCCASVGRMPMPGSRALPNCAASPAICWRRRTKVC
jgi:hypothetical protein